MGYLVSGCETSSNGVHWSRQLDDLRLWYMCGGAGAPDSPRSGACPEDSPGGVGLGLGLQGEGEDFMVATSEEVEMGRSKWIPNGKLPLLQKLAHHKS